MGLFSKSIEVEFTVPDMNCNHCEAKVTKAIESLPHVKKVQATSSDKKLKITVNGESAPDLTTVNGVLEPAGYRAE